MVLNALRSRRTRLILAAVIGAFGLAQLIIGCVLSADVYQWGISAFTCLAGLGCMGYSGFVVYSRGEINLELGFGLCFSLLLVNLQGTFVLGACTASLAEDFANQMIDIYDGYIKLMLTKECTDCIDAEELINAQVLEANSQNFAGETAFAVFSCFQMVALLAGCIAYFDNNALNELGVVPKKCISVAEQDSTFRIESEEGGFDDL